MQNQVMLDEPRCPNCGSTLVYIRLKRNEQICRKCGYIKDLNNSEEQNA